MNARVDKYKTILAEFGIDPTDDSYSGGEDAGLHLSGESPIERFCVVTRHESFVYAKAIWPDLESAQAAAVEYIADDTFFEVPVAIIDLDTGERFAPVMEIPWKRVA